MSNAGTSILWSCASSRDLPSLRRPVRPMWSYYARVSVASPHCRVASGADGDGAGGEDAGQTSGGERHGDPVRETGPPATTRRGGLAHGSSRSEIRDYGPWSLTQRELEVLQLLAEGATNGEISQRLYISPKTAKNHLAAIFQKLDVTNRTQALVRAVVMGLVNIE